MPKMGAKVFNHRRYTPFNFYTYKRDADKQASVFRKNGYLVRVVKQITGAGMTWYWVYYALPKNGKVRADRF